VERALEKLRAAFLRRGVAATAALASVISANAVQIAPAGLAATLTSASLAAAGTGTTLTLLKLMTITKLKLGLGALVIAGATTALVVQHQAQEKLRAENESLRRQITQLQADNENLSNLAARAKSPLTLSDDQINELLKLRGEVGTLKNQLATAQTIQAQTVVRPAQADEPDGLVAQQKRMQEHKMARARNLAGAAMFGYAEHHQNQFPANWVQIERYFDQWERNGLNPGDVMPDTAADFGQVTNEFDLVYQGSTTNLFGTTNFGDTIVVREKQPWQMPDGRWAKVYGFADGHSQLVAEPDGSFDAFEQQHMALPPDQ
jgi:hypothetical protein